LENDPDKIDENEDEDEDGDRKKKQPQDTAVAKKRSTLDEVTLFFFVPP